MVAHIVGEYVEIGLLDPQVERLRASYKMRCEALLQGLAQHMPQEVTWTRPGGGFFVWLTLPEGMESEALQDRAKEAGVAFVPGSQFCCCGGGERSMRLAFSRLDEAQLQEGAKRLAQALTLYIENLS